MAFVITAELPLGTYRGAGSDGRPEPMPSVSRLHSALLCAAGFGPRAVRRDDDLLGICDADRIALHWLEANPPDSVQIPSLEVNVRHAIAYRNDGTIHTSKSVKTIKKLDKSASDSAAVGGQFAWIWRELPPQPVLTAIEQLCPDVAYLGTSECPVRLRAMAHEEVEPTHQLDDAAGLFDAAVSAIERPAPGRTSELSEAHYAAIKSPPSVAKDKTKTDEKSMSPVPTRTRVLTARYRSFQASMPAPTPWSHAIVVPLTEPIAERHRVAWAIAAHRALVKLIGYGAPAFVTGVYPPGVSKPANRLALQLLSPDMPCPLPASRAPASLAILVPSGTEPADLEILRRAIQNLTSLRAPGGKLIKVSQPGMRIFDGSEFWLPPEPGHVRLWRTVPAAIPDTRGADGWTFAHAALLSLGFVWKDFLPEISGRGPDNYRRIAAATSDLGAAAVHATATRTTDVSQYSHKVNEHAVVRPYTAVLTLGDLTGPRTVQAIGQSRHLGGGLLVPFDMAEGTTVGEIRFDGVVPELVGGDHGARRLR